jgi:hypothetical protein
MVSLGEVGRDTRSYKLTIVYTYYGQQERIPDIIKEKHLDTRVIVVDDGSPEPLMKVEGIDVYRIVEDIPWNVPGARNLGFHVSEGWIVSTDIDHLVTFDNVEEILHMDKERGVMYLLGRKDVDTGEESTHFSELLIHKDDFEIVGGFDEDFSGYYGLEDFLFILQCRRNLKVVEARHIKTRMFDNCPSKGHSRDYTRNTHLFEQKKHLQRNESKRLNFNWFMRGLESDV